MIIDLLHWLDILSNAMDKNKILRYTLKIAKKCKIPLFDSSVAFNKVVSCDCIMHGHKNLYSVTLVKSYNCIYEMYELSARFCDCIYMCTEAWF